MCDSGCSLADHLQAANMLHLIGAESRFTCRAGRRQNCDGFQLARLSRPAALADGRGFT